MTKHYIILAIISIFIGTATAQQSELPKTFPFFKSHSSTAIRPSAASALQKAKAMNSTAETTYTHRIDSVIAYTGGENNSNSNAYVKLICTYKNNQLTELNNWQLNSTNSTYNLSLKYKYTYDIQNRVDSMYEINYSETNGKMQYGESHHYSYDNSNRTSSISNSLWLSQNSEWYQTTTTYNQYSGTNISCETTRNTATNEVNKYLYHFFDAYKNDTLKKSYYLSFGNKYPYHTARTKYSYGTAGNVLSSTQSDYKINYPDSTIQSLTHNITFNYDNNGNIDSYTENDFNSSTGDVEFLVSLTTSDIDLNYKTAEILGYDKLQIPLYPNNMTKQWNINMEGTTLTYKLYYSPLIKDGLSNTNASQTVKVLSGAAAGSVQLQMPVEANYNTAIYNAAGSKIQTIHTNSNTIAINKLAAGVYFYNISSEKANFNGKFIVK